MGTPKKLLHRMKGTPNAFSVSTTSTEVAWSPDLVTKSGATFTWHVKGDISPIPAPQVVNDPTFNLANNTGVVTLVAHDSTLLTVFEDQFGENITAVDITECPNLDRIELEDNQISNIDVTQNIALTRLVITANQLTTLDVSQNINLTSLLCDYNSLTTLDVTNLTNLAGLLCNSNWINSLDVSQNTLLTSLNISSNGYQGPVSFPNNNLLVLLKVSNNPGIGSLDVSNLTALNTLWASWCGLSTLNLTNNVNLEHLKCALQNISSLDISTCTKLFHLECGSNNMSSTSTDSIWNQMSTIATAGNFTNGILIIRNNRTVAADAAYANLVGRGYTITETTS